MLKKYCFMIAICIVCFFTLSGCASVVDAEADEDVISYIYNPIDNPTIPQAGEIYEFYEYDEFDGTAGGEYDNHEFESAAGEKYDNNGFESTVNGENVTSARGRIIFLDSEIRFITMLNDFGLDWSFSPMQTTPWMRHPGRSENHRVYHIICPAELVFAMIQIRKSYAAHPDFQTALDMSFATNREPTEDELTHLQRYGLLTDDEWSAFLSLAGIMLDREDDVANIARYAELFLEDSAADPVLQGREGAVEYRFSRGWHPYAEIYHFIEFELGVIFDE